MLDVALNFLKDEANAFLALRTGSETVRVVLSKVADEAGKYAFPIDSIGCSVVSFEEDRVLRNQVPEYATIGGQQVATPPPLKLHLHLLFAAHFTHYDQALKYLALLLTFFQSHPHFAVDRSPSMPAGLDNLALDLLTLNYEQLNQLWAFVGAKQLPSVVYRLRHVPLADSQPATIQPPLTTIRTTLRSR